MAGRVLLMLVFLLAGPSCTSPSKPLETLTSTDQAVLAFFEKSFESSVQRHPEFATYLGRRVNYDQWEDYSEDFLKKEIALLQEELRQSTQFDLSKLSGDTKTSLVLFQKMHRDALEDARWRHHHFHVNQMFGIHTNITSLLMDQHKIESLADAEAYVRRVAHVQTPIEQIRRILLEQEKRGVLYPQFTYPKALSDIRNLTAGAPFSEGATPSPLWEDFQNKLRVVSQRLPGVFTEAVQSRLMEDMKTALRGPYQTAFRGLATELNRLSKKAKHNHGAWSLPQGEEYYRQQVAKATTTKLSPEQIHQIGLNEVKRIHAEMNNIMKEVRFEGNRKDFFKKIKTDPTFTYPNSAEGRAQIVKDTERLIQEVREKSQSYFSKVPSSPVQVKPVEAYREKSAGKAFYNGPSVDGSRPGIYYLNLSNIKALPKTEIPALTYHETIPGHHFQIAFAQGLTSLPEFRRHLFFTAYVEGWGLYSEKISGEMGLYRDPYTNFGRLSMELWRACRLVVDTGLHFKKWSREKAIQFLLDNTPTDPEEATKSIERYIVMPGQATAYTVGMLKILELRAFAQAKLGTRFKVSAFHDEILKHGALPLDVLEMKVNEWIAQQPPMTTL